MAARTMTAPAAVACPPFYRQARGGRHSVPAAPANCVHNTAFAARFSPAFYHFMTATSLIADIVLGAILGVTGGLFGIGGGVIAIPVLGLLFGMNQPLAQGTALVMVAPNVIMGFWQYHRRNHLDLRMIALLCLSAILFTYLGARLATIVDAAALRTAFALFLIALTVFFAWQLLRGRGAQARIVLARPWAMVVGMLGGLTSGLFGVGGGVIAAPALTGLFGVTQAAAQGFSLALVSPGAVVALGTYAAADLVDWHTGIPLALGGMLSIPWGVALAHRLPERKLRLLFCGLLLVTALMMLQSP